ncbi:formylglycine-generating enzyme family protein [Gimesia panareensis]|uniref:formylglycine-generating enzyme family protein n=1 Tax=Gimesia panareensis TaxID=2527978 RepID=UPI0018D9F113|nr:formylglycine-generating enzyme family protein [Gimesia panareensis]
MACTQAVAQTVPPEILHERLRSLDEPRERFFVKGPEEFDFQREFRQDSFREARRVFREKGELDQASIKRLSSVFTTNAGANAYGSFTPEQRQKNQEAFARIGGSTNREFMLIDSLWYFQKRPGYERHSDWQAFCAAHAVNRHGDSDHRDALDAEAYAVQAMIYLQAGILAPAYGCASRASEAREDFLLAKGLMTALEARGKYLTGPSRYFDVLGRRPNGDTYFQYRAEFWRGNDEADQPLCIALKGPDFLFIGALVLQRKKTSDDQMHYRLMYRDFDAAPLLIADFGTERPDEEDLIELIDDLTPAIGLSRPAYKVAEPVRTQPEYTDLRCEIESLYWQREQVWPLAAWWIQQVPKSDKLAQKYGTPLKNAQHEDWNFLGRFDVDGDLSGGSFLGFSLLGFANDNSPDDISSAPSLEHYHYIVCPGQSDQYMLSYVISSRSLDDGKRYYFLERRVGGESEIVKILGSELPAPEAAQQEVLSLLYKNAAKSLNVEYQDEPPVVTLARAKQLKAAEVTGQPVTLKNSLGMSFSLIPAGLYQMGSPATEIDRRDDETQHLVQLTDPYYLGTFEVTQAQYQRIMGSNPSYFSPEGGYKDRLPKDLDTSSYPVENVPGKEALEFCKRLTQLPEEIRAGRRYRLPTEAEWEYACRALTTTRFPSGYQVSSLKRIANVEDASSSKKPSSDKPFDTYLWNDGYEYTAPVGSFQPNAWGLFDMLGNVSERCSDIENAQYYDWSPRANPAGPADGRGMVLRGSHYFSGYGYLALRDLRTANRAPLGEGIYGLGAGLRVVCEVPGRKPPRFVNEAVSRGSAGVGGVVHITVPESLIKGRYWVYVDGTLLRSEFEGRKEVQTTRTHRTESGLYVYNEDGDLLCKCPANGGSGYLNKKLVETRQFSVELPVYVNERSRFLVELMTSAGMQTTEENVSLPLAVSQVYVDCKVGEEAEVELAPPIDMYLQQLAVLPNPLGEDAAQILLNRFTEKKQKLFKDKLFLFLYQNMKRSQLPQFDEWRLQVPIPDARFAEAHGSERVVDDEQMRILIDWLKQKYWGELESEAKRYQNYDNVKSILDLIETEASNFNQFNIIADAMQKVRKRR